MEGGGCNGGGNVDINGYGISTNIEMQNLSDIGWKRMQHMALLDTDSNTSY